MQLFEKRYFAHRISCMIEKCYFVETGPLPPPRAADFGGGAGSCEGSMAGMRALDAGQLCKQTSVRLESASKAPQSERMVAGWPGNASGPNPEEGKTMAILQDLTQAQAEIDRLQALLAKATKPRKLTLKVSEKGAVSAYGMGKWPVTLYAEQWERLLASAEEIRDFIQLNRSSLSTKD